MWIGDAPAGVPPLPAVVQNLPDPLPKNLLQIDMINYSGTPAQAGTTVRAWATATVDGLDTQGTEGTQTKAAKPEAV